MSNASAERHKHSAFQMYRSDLGAALPPSTAPSTAEVVPELDSRAACSDHMPLAETMAMRFSDTAGRLV